MSKQISKELREKIEADSEKWVNKLDNILTKDFNPFELYIIKCHLILEYELNIYIEKKTNNRLPMETAGFTFSEKIKICKMIGCFEGLPDLESFLMILNKIRNQIAHNFSYEKKYIKQLFAICAKYDKNKKSNDYKESIHVLDYTISFFAGSLSMKVEYDILHEALEIISKEKTRK